MVRPQAGGARGPVAAAVAIVAALLASGCSRPMPVHPVSGRVTLDGKPLVDAQISFRPAQGPEAFATLDRDGRYTLSTRAAGDGAVAGTHAVTLSQVTVGLALEPGVPPKLEKPTPGAVPVPEKYLRAETSGLSATVAPGVNTFDFDLTAR
jgi:hypothetical protein